MGKAGVVIFFLLGLLLLYLTILLEAEFVVMSLAATPTPWP